MVRLGIAWLFICVDVLEGINNVITQGLDSTYPNNVIRKTIDTITGPLGHLSETFSFSLVLESITWEVDACILLAFNIHCLEDNHTRSMNISLNQNVDTTYSIKLNLLVFVFSPITHLSHVCTTSLVFFVTFRKNNIFIETGGQFSSLIRLDPRIVIKSTFDISSVLVTMEPDVCNMSAMNASLSTTTLTGNNNIPIMIHEILNNLLRTIHNIHISPINPRMIRLQSRIQQVISRFT